MKKMRYRWQISLWVIALSALILPGRSPDDFKFDFGYPAPFLHVYNNTLLEPNHILLENIAIDPLSFFIDAALLVALINLIYKFYRTVIKKEAAGEKSL